LYLDPSHPPPKHSGPTTQGNHTSTPARYGAVSEGLSRRVFLRVDRNHPDRRNAKPTSIITFLVEKLGFPRRDIVKVYPVNSGFAIEVFRPELRSSLAAKAKVHYYRIDPEVLTFAYLVKNVPKYILAHDGSRRHTDPLIVEAVAAVTGDVVCAGRDRQWVKWVR